MTTNAIAIFEITIALGRAIKKRREELTLKIKQKKKSNSFMIEIFG